MHNAANLPWVKRITFDTRRTAGLARARAQTIPNSETTIFTSFCHNMVSDILEELFPEIVKISNTAEAWRRDNLKGGLLYEYQKYSDTRLPYMFGIRVGTSGDFYIERVKGGKFETDLVGRFGKIIDRLIVKNYPDALIENTIFKSYDRRFKKPPSQDFVVVTQPLDYVKGLLRAVLHGDKTPESATSVSVLYKGVPICSIIVGHNGEILTTDGGSVRYYSVDTKTLTVTGDHIVMPFAVHNYDGSEIINPLLITKERPSSAEMYKIRAQLRQALGDYNQRGVGDIYAAGPYRIFEMARLASNQRYSVLAHTGNSVDWASSAPSMAITLCLNGGVWVDTLSSNISAIRRMVTNGDQYFGMARPAEEMPAFLYGDNNLIAALSDSRQIRGLLPAFSTDALNKARFAIGFKPNRQSDAETWDYNSEDYKMQVARGIFFQYCYESAINGSGYMMSVMRHVLEVANEPEDKKRDFLRLIDPEDELARVESAPNQRIYLSLKPGEEKNAQPVTTVDITADLKIYYEKLSINSTLADILAENNILLLTEEGPKPLEDLLKSIDFVVVVDGLDNTNGFVEWICRKLGIPHPENNKPVAAHSTQNHVSINYALLYKGQPIEGILAFPIKDSPVFLRTCMEADDGSTVERIGMTEYGKPDISPRREFKPYKPVKENIDIPSELRCRIGYGDAHNKDVKSFLEKNGYRYNEDPHKPEDKIFSFNKASGQERILSLLNGNAELVFNSRMMSWDIAATVGIARNLGYDIAVLPNQSNHNYDKPLNFATTEKMPATVIGHPKLLKQLGLTPELELLAKDRGRGGIT